jgi:hypothetical protein
MTRPLVWQALLLVPQPLLALAYLAAIRAERLRPSLLPVLALAVLPIASAALGVRSRRTGAGTGRGWQAALFIAAVLELAWTAVAAAMVGFAIAWRSG